MKFTLPKRATKLLHGIFGRFLNRFYEDVAGDPELNLPDGIHPTEVGHKIVARNLWTFLEPI